MNEELKALTADKVKAGTVFNFDNEAWCEETETDDFRGGFLTWNPKRSLFLVFFNGACVCAVSTFRPAKVKVQRLFDNWHCVPTDREQA